MTTRKRLWFILWNPVTGSVRYKSFVKESKDQMDAKVSSWLAAAKKELSTQTNPQVRLATYTSMRGIRTRLRTGFDWTQRAFAKALLQIVREHDQVDYEPPLVQSIDKHHDYWEREWVTQIKKDRYGNRKKGQGKAFDL